MSNEVKYKFVNLSMNRAAEVYAKDPDHVDKQGHSFHRVSAEAIQSKYDIIWDASSVLPAAHQGQRAAPIEVKSFHCYDPRGERVDSIVKLTKPSNLTKRTLDTVQESERPAKRQKTEKKVLQSPKAVESNNQALGGSSSSESEATQRSWSSFEFAPPVSKSLFLILNEPNAEISSSSVQYEFNKTFGSTNTASGLFDRQ